MSIAVTPSLFWRRAESTHSCMHGPGAERS